jgi:hypothetical protein
MKVFSLNLLSHFVKGKICEHENADDIFTIVVILIKELN